MKTWELLDSSASISHLQSLLCLWDDKEKELRKERKGIEKGKKKRRNWGRKGKKLRKERNLEKKRDQNRNEHLGCWCCRKFRHFMTFLFLLRTKCWRSNDCFSQRMKILEEKNMIWVCWNILLCFSKWKILTLTFGLIRASAVLNYNFLETFYFFFSLFLFPSFSFSIFNSFPSLFLLSPFLSSLFSPCSFFSFLTTGLCSVFYSDLKNCAEKLVQSITRHFPKPLDFLLKSPSQVWSELSPSYKIWEDHILQWCDSNHETSILICKSHSALPLSYITG